MAPSRLTFDGFGGEDEIGALAQEVESAGNGGERQPTDPGKNNVDHGDHSPAGANIFVGHGFPPICPAPDLPGPRALAIQKGAGRE